MSMPPDYDSCVILAAAIDGDIEVINNKTEGSCRKMRIRTKNRVKDISFVFFAGKLQYKMERSASLVDGNGRW